MVNMAGHTGVDGLEGLVYLGEFPRCEYQAEDDGKEQYLDESQSAQSV